MIERAERFDVRFAKLGDQVFVEFQSLGVDLAFLGHHAAHADREAVAFEPQLLHQRHILLVAVVVIAGLVAGIAVFDMTVGSVPDA